MRSNSDFDHATLSEGTAALNGVIALLAAAGLSDTQIRAVTGRDAHHVCSLLEAAAEPPAHEYSVIDRARMTLLRERSLGDRRGHLSGNGELVDDPPDDDARPVDVKRG